MFDHFIDAFPHAFSLYNVVVMVVGLIGGIAVGAMPGVNATMAIAMLLPLTFTMEPLAALGAIAGIYNGAMYGGAIPAILLRIPGTPAAIATTFDGFPMAKRGEAGKALEIASYSSAIGGICGSLVLLLVAPPLSRIALQFGPPEMFWVGVFGILSLAFLLGHDVVKGLISAGIGMFLGCIGTDLVTGQERYTFGSVNLVGGLDVATVLIGLFALPPTLELAEDCLRKKKVFEIPAITAAIGLFAAVRRFWLIWFRSSIVGVLIGILPGAGGNLAAILAYNETKRRAPDPENYGTGKPEGVAASECANNADNGAALIPALTLGVPGTIVAALIIGALMIQGMQPGPQLFRTQPDIVYGFMMQMLFTAVLIIPLGGLVASRLFSKVLFIPPYLLVPLILALTVAGVFSINNNTFDIGVLLVMGVLGYLMEKLAIPLAPASLGLILGPMVEENMRIALLLSRGDWTIFFTRPLSLAIIAALTLVIGLPMLNRYRRRSAQARRQQTPQETAS